MPNQHIIPHPDGWAVKPEKGERPSKVHPTKIEAIEDGREKAKNQHSELFIHNKDGKISDRDSYGSDPNPPKDKKH